MTNIAVSNIIIAIFVFGFAGVMCWIAVDSTIHHSDFWKED